MGRVIALDKKKNVDLGWVEFLEEMLASARRGESGGGIGVVDLADGTQRIFSRGTFAKDERRAVRISSNALDLYCKDAGIAHPKVAAYCALPPRLKKAT